MASILPTSTRRECNLNWSKVGSHARCSPPDALKDKQVNWVFGGWFPDSTRFLVNACPFGLRPEELSSHGTSIWIFSVLGTEPRHIRDDAVANGISPDGSAIAFQQNTGRFGDREIWLMGPDGANARKLYDTDENSSINGVAWSPDGRLIALLTD